MESAADLAILVCALLILGLYVVTVAFKRARLGCTLGSLDAAIVRPWRRSARDADQSSADAFVAKLMDKKRGEMITVTSSVCQFVFFLSILWGVVNIVSGRSRIRNYRQDGTMLIAFGTQILANCDHNFGSGRVNSSVVYVVTMLSWTLFVITTSDTTHLVPTNAFMYFPRVIFSLAYMKSRTVCLVCVLHTAASSLTYSYMLAQTSHAPTACGASQDKAITNMTEVEFTRTDLMCCFIVVLTTLGWEMTMTMHARKELEVTATRGETTATRRLLNTICDAIFELDTDLRIVDDALQLAGALQHGADRSLRGMLAENLLVAEDRALFRERVTTPVLASQSMANVMHVRMRDSLNNILKVEIFHVPVAGSLTGASHLIGVREHADCGECPVKWLPVPGRLVKGPRAARAESPSARLGTPAVAASESIGSSSDGPPARRAGNSSSSSSDTQPAPPEGAAAQPLFVRFDALSLVVAESSGTHSELFRPGTSLARFALAQQDFFADLSAAVASLNLALASDPEATLRFQSALSFDHDGAVLEGSCSVVLARGEACSSLDASGGHLVEASLQFFRPARAARPRNGSVSNERSKPVHNHGSHISDSSYLNLMMQGLRDVVSDTHASGNGTALV